MAKLKVYISSTYRDLKEHRKQLIEFFGKKTIRENFDLISMEGYVATDIAPAMECIEDVKKCDIFILILANRYGFIPQDNNPAGISITEIEYNTALADSNKTILAFFADETDPRFESDDESNAATSELKKQKLIAFKTRVRNEKLTHPEPFISSFHLSLQVAESLMRKSFIAFRLESARSYCCDRVPQFSKFLQVRTKGTFKSFIIYGSRKELGLNLINRVNIFSLDLTEDAIQSQLVTFEDFMISTDYEENKKSLLAFVFDRYFPNKLPDDFSLIKFLDAFQKIEVPVVLAIDCDATMFEDNQVEFIRQFMEELYNTSLTTPGCKIFLFLNFEVNDDSLIEALEQKIKQIQARVETNEDFLCVLPKLQALNRQLIRTWIINYITPNPGRAEALMEACFKDLSTPLNMMEADEKIHKFMKSVNDNNADILQLIT